jgi:hypothetical protein
MMWVMAVLEDRREGDADCGGDGEEEPQRSWSLSNLLPSRKTKKRLRNNFYSRILLLQTTSFHKAFFVVTLDFHFPIIISKMMWISDVSHFDTISQLFRVLHHFVDLQVLLESSFLKRFWEAKGGRHRRLDKRL